MPSLAGDGRHGAAAPCLVRSGDYASVVKGRSVPVGLWGVWGEISLNTMAI